MVKHNKSKSPKKPEIDIPNLNPAVMNGLNILVEVTDREISEERLGAILKDIAEQGPVGEKGLAFCLNKAVEWIINVNKFLTKHGERGVPLKERKQDD